MSANSGQWSETKPYCVWDGGNERNKTGGWGHVQHKVMSASIKDGTAGKNFEAQRGWLFVSLGPRIDGTLELAEEIETTSPS